MAPGCVDLTDGNARVHGRDRASHDVLHDDLVVHAGTLLVAGAFTRQGEIRSPLPCPESVGRPTSSMAAMRSWRRFLAIALGMLAASCAVEAPSPSQTSDARAELAGLIQDVTAATAYRYRLSDDHGRWMDTVKVIETGRQAPAFVAVYHSWSEEDSRFHVMVATSDDLLTWAWRTELAVMASQPYIAAVGDGFVVAWEQEPDPIHIVLASYPSLEALIGAVPDRRQDLPVTMPACGEGTPSIDLRRRPKPSR